ncbi:hypothetical protein [Pontivivens ytuae]|uniref:Nickel transport protein n=1 Tax=Pontivivens ytuae TaxID=2789856 RepID=A0A7S9LSV7_9RHOB|nr:hypothetical protein [Pontivivens ytuae]QPH54514.1 hypothetical protein I0K15_01660 [Pontivivens ytuae]
MSRLRALTASLALIAPASAGAHQLNVFASVDCEAVLVEAKFSNGRAPVEGKVRVLDGENTLLTTLALEADGTRRVPLDGLDHSGGLVIEVDTGSHDDYWILTPEDIARHCGS